METQMEFYYHMYFSEDLAGKKAQLIRKLKQNRLPPGIYVIALASGPQNHLEFFDGLLLRQKIFRTEHLFVIGIASGYEEALYLTEKITDDVYQNTGKADIRRYILDGQKAYKEGKRQVD